MALGSTLTGVAGSEGVETQLSLLAVMKLSEVGLSSSSATALGASRVTEVKQLKLSLSLLAFPSVSWTGELEAPWEDL